MKLQIDKMDTRGGDKIPVDRKRGDWLGVAMVGVSFPSTAPEL